MSRPNAMMRAAARDVGIDIGLAAWGYADPGFLRSLAPTLFFERMDESRRL